VLVTVPPRYLGARSHPAPRGEGARTSRPPRALRGRHWRGPWTRLRAGGRSIGATPRSTGPATTHRFCWCSPATAPLRMANRAAGRMARTKLEAGDRAGRGILPLAVSAPPPRTEAAAGRRGRTDGDRCGGRAEPPASPGPGFPGPRAGAGLVFTRFAYSADGPRIRGSRHAGEAARRPQMAR